MRKYSFAALQDCLGTNAIHLWRIPLAQPEFNDEMALSAQESRQAARFQFAQDRRRYINAHVALRVILSGYLGCAPHEVSLQIGARGKPCLEGESGLFFNLAHSGEVALLGVTRAGEIGVDVEQIRPLDAMHELAETCFSAQELRQWRALPPQEQHVAFFHAWARKEALIKALGEGLSHPLQDFTVSLMPGQPARLLEIHGSADEAAAWQLHSVDAGADYAAAFALRAQRAPGQITSVVLDYSFPSVSVPYVT